MEQICARRWSLLNSPGSRSPHSELDLRCLRHAVGVPRGIPDDVDLHVLDAFDPSLIPATGTPEPGGLSWYQVTDLLRRVARASRVVGFDVVELLPSPGEHASAFTAAKLVYRFLAEVFSQRAG